MDVQALDRVGRASAPRGEATGCVTSPSHPQPEKLSLQHPRKHAMKTIKTALTTGATVSRASIVESAHDLGGCKVPVAENSLRRHVTLLATVSFVLTAPLALSAQAQDVLPRPEQSFKGYMGRVVKDSVKDFPQEVTAPAGAPNILLIITD